MKDTMKAVVLRGPRDLAVIDLPVPVPGPGDVVMRVAACGICGSDLRYFDGENPWAKHTLGYEKPNPPDMVLGHEIGGYFDGARVAALAFKGCGRCVYCRRGLESLCAQTAHLGHGAGWEGTANNPGGMAEYCPVWPEHLYQLPEGVSCAEGTFLDGLGVAVHAVHRAQMPTGGDFVVIGAGPIGLSIMQTAKALGAGRAWLVDIYDVALECGSLLGAEEVRNAGSDGLPGLADEILQATSGRGVDTIFESTGDLEAQQAAIRALARGGCLMLMAGAAEGLTLGEGALAGERRITTSSNHLYEEYQTGLDLMAMGKVKVGEMITHKFGIADAARAFEVATNKPEHGALKVIIEP